MNKQDHTLHSTPKQVLLWAMAACTFPVVALAGLFLIHFIGWDTMYEQALVLSATIFFTAAVFWWWWVIYKISAFSQLLVKSNENFDIIKQELLEIKKDIRK